MSWQTFQKYFLVMALAQFCSTAFSDDLSNKVSSKSAVKSAPSPQPSDQAADDLVKAEGSGAEDLATKDENYEEDELVLQRKFKGKKGESEKLDDDLVTVDGSSSDETAPTEAPYIPKKKSNRKKKNTAHRLEKPARISKEGVYFYDAPASPQSEAFSFRVGKYSPPNLANEAGTPFGTIYSQNSAIMMGLDYEYQFLRSLGKMGITLGGGFFTATGNGRFVSTGVKAKEIYTFYMFPLNVGLVYRLQFWDKQPLVPFALAGSDYFVFVETRDDQKRTKYGGTALAHVGGGGSLLLDFLEGGLARTLDSEYGINHMWLTGEYRKYVKTGGAFDFSGDMFNLGLLIEY